ncbi:hypothetical protein CPB97_005812, partial [Podila verticillata]
VRDLIALYCANDTVVLKNTQDYTFVTATQVFGQMEQTPSYLVVPSLPCDDAVTLRDRFYNLQKRHQQIKKAQANKKQEVELSNREKADGIPTELLSLSMSSADLRALTKMKDGPDPDTPTRLFQIIQLG